VLTSEQQAPLRTPPHGRSPGPRRTSPSFSRRLPSTLTGWARRHRRRARLTPSSSLVLVSGRPISSGMSETSSGNVKHILTTHQNYEKVPDQGESDRQAGQYLLIQHNALLLTLFSLRST
jgi:hypothetical protein